jgi:hypothetical protein
VSEAGSTMRNEERKNRSCNFHKDVLEFTFLRLGALGIFFFNWLLQGLFKLIVARLLLQLAVVASTG